MWVEYCSKRKKKSSSFFFHTMFSKVRKKIKLWLNFSRLKVKFENLNNFVNSKVRITILLFLQRFYFLGFF